mgnify:FL=1
MIVFNGSVAHGGAAYDKDNIRVFWKVVPESLKQEILGFSTEELEYLALPCNHNKLDAPGASESATETDSPVLSSANEESDEEYFPTQSRKRRKRKR